ncbi:hypothetical protein IWW55_002096 [Coemansia sp. RSA 2706]|nr:hypothetical protein IWW54_005383 [Coemansia sp. RSA 2705]KAJ2305114.1 hypothetical protein IWW55_002096 [Coemansia sp. RSA 2706]KAJ2311616.1 hypothetical protein IWW52_005087 [Coemansia sp. RSA 2704]KAJ2361295.1 hypothetical protein H4S01_005333 [Coemansia sp. RSA 2610]KAJ2718996.1 hypothetical protein H4R23_004924 [Coemansia sp. Cherry 401B]
MSGSHAAQVVESVASTMAEKIPGYVDIFDQFGVIRPEHDDRTASEMTPADMFYLTMLIALVGGSAVIIGGYYISRTLCGKKLQAAGKTASAKPSKKSN